MIKVLITAKAYKYSPGQVVEMTEFDAGHAFGFKYGVPYIEQRPTIETAIAKPPEVRELNHEHNPVEVKPIEQVEKQTFFKRRGRKPNR
jgi:hypothetical protein